MTALTALASLLVVLQGLSKLKHVLPFAAGILGLSLIIPSIAKAEITTTVGRCNKHGWIVQEGEYFLSIGKSHDWIVRDENGTLKGGWTYTNLPGVIKLHSPNSNSEKETMLYHPKCANGESRFN